MQRDLRTIDLFPFLVEKRVITPIAIIGSAGGIGMGGACGHIAWIHETVHRVFIGAGRAHHQSACNRPVFQTNTIVAPVVTEPLEGFPDAVISPLIRAILVNVRAFSREIGDHRIPSGLTGESWAAALQPLWGGEPPAVLALADKRDAFVRWIGRSGFAARDAAPARGCAIAVLGAGITGVATLGRNAHGRVVRLSHHSGGARAHTGAHGDAGHLRVALATLLTGGCALAPREIALAPGGARHLRAGHARFGACAGVAPVVAQALEGVADAIIAPFVEAVA